MNIQFFLAFAVFLIGNFGSRYIIQNAYTLLTDAEKLKILELNINRKNSKRGLIVMLITIVYLAIIFFKLLPIEPVFYLFMASAITYLIHYHFNSAKQLAMLGINEGYIYKVKFSSAVRLVGIIVFAVLLAVSFK